MASFDYDLFVIGAGSGGVRAARVAAGLGARVAIAEADRVGGTCVIRGCVPKKLFVTASHFAEAFEDAAGFGWTIDGLRFDWPTLVANVAADVEWLSGVYVRNLEKSGAELIRSRAVLEDAHRIRLGSDGRTVTAGTILIATGGAPSVERDIPGIEHTITSNDVFHLDRLPERILVMGGGYIAVEFAGVFNGLGSQTHLVCRADNVLRNFDDDIRQWVRAGMERHGIEVVSGDMIAAVERSGRNLVAMTDKGRRIEVDQVLMALGRKPASRGMGLEEVGVAIDHDGAIRVDALSKTSADNIYAVGDVTNRKLLTPVAIREGAAFAETIFGGKPMEVDYALIPTAVFSQPEVGTVGLTEEQAKAKYSMVDIYRANFKPLPNRVAKREERMLIKLVVDAATDLLLGCHIVGPSASELAQLVAVPMKMGATKADFDATVAIHPTLAEEIVTIPRPVERHRRAAAE